MPNRSRSFIARLLFSVIVLVIVAVAAAAGVLWWFLSSDRVRQAIESRATRELGEPVKIERAAADLLPRPTVRLLGVSVGAGGERARLEEVRLSTALRPLFARRLDDAEVIVRGGRVDLAGLLGLYQAASETEPDDGRAADGVTVGSVRAIALEEVDVDAGGTALRTAARARLEQGRLEIERFQAVGAGSQLELTGTIVTGPAPTATLFVDASLLDMEALAALAGAIEVGGASRSQAPASPAVRLTMAVRATRGTLAGLTFTDLETRVEATGGQVRLDPLATSIFDGRFSGTVQVTPSGGGTAFRVVGSLTEADASALLRHLEQSTEILTGRLTANIRLDLASGTGPLIERLRGTVGLRAGGGSIQGLSAVRRAIVGLSGRSDSAPDAASDRYQELSGTFGMAGARLDTRDLTLVTEDLDVRARGSVNLAAGTVALDADLVLSPELSDAAGRDLLRYAREGNRIVLPGRIGGTFAEPRVTLDVADAVQRALRNRLQEEASSWLERLRKGGREP